MQLKIGTNKFNKFQLLLAAILIFAAVLRFYNLNQVPASLYWDEVSIGYNAYSIVETGKDEYGKSMPLFFKAYDDYKAPGLIYLTTIPVKIFGLNEFSVRLPSAFFGILTVLITYFLVLEILIKKKIFGFDSKYVALLTSFVLAISPWHLQLSRAGFEANVGLFFTVMGGFIFFKFINSKNFKFLFFSVILYGLSFYFYRSMWFFVPLLLAGLYLINFRLLIEKKNIIKTLLSIIIFLIIVFPISKGILSDVGGGRSAQVNIIYNIQDQLNDAWVKKHSSGPIGKIIYDRRTVYLTEIGKGYASHFSPSYLFVKGDPNPRHGVGSVGAIYFWGVLFLIPGLFALFKIDRKYTFSVFLWLFLAPIPAAVSYPTPHALRSINMIPMLQFTVVLGAVWLFSFVSERYRKVVSAIVIGLCLYFVINYFGIYYGNYIRSSASDWGDGNKQLVEYVKENESKYDKILVTGHWWQPHMYFLFYTKQNPASYQEYGSKYGFDKYIFSGTSWDMDGKEFGDQDLEQVAGTKNFLVALSPAEYEIQREDLTKLDEIKNKNNEVVFVVAENK